MVPIVPLVTGGGKPPYETSQGQRHDRYTSGAMVKMTVMKETGKVRGARVKAVPVSGKRERLSPGGP